MVFEKMESKSGTGTGSETLVDATKPGVTSIPLKEVYSKIMKQEGAWSTVDTQLAEKIKSLLLNVKKLDPSLTLTAVVEYPVNVSYIHKVKEDGTRECLAIGSGATADEATATSAERALKIVRKCRKKNPFV
ncbi:unnamed protein product [Allacma fusca]|uniref:Uncharacterized protein n=1 Tax=Allacma fusca TaxID=39272 RepID=A0A8J2KAV9_9HEXA|nr:unnamed protein product [Allacma fusca]